MGVLDRFKRKNESVLPEEADEYYREERVGSRSAALLLGLATFVTTLIVGGALYLGGRAVYRALSDDNGNQETAVTEQQQETPPPASPQPGSNSVDETPGGETLAGDAAPSNQDNQPSSTTRTGDDIPNTGDQTTTTNLPATGDPGM